MALVPKEHGSGTARLIGVALAAGLPLMGYLLTASAHGYWLDAGEFIAASVNLGIAHPPGQPLSALVGRLFALLPLGPLGLRVTLASAAMAACAAAALFCAVHTTVAAMGENRQWVSIPLSMGVTWFVAGSHGWWFQAVRPEVYALQAALTCVVIERVVALEARWPSKDARPLITAALALGLALANHHLLAMLTLPALMPISARVLRSRGFRPFFLACGAGLLALAVYVYLPLRAAADPLPNLGEPLTLSRIWWVVSAQAFQKNVGGGVPQPMAERYADVAVALWENLLVAVPIGMAGLYVLLRTAGARRIGVVWMLLLVFNAAARAWLGFIRSNPDAAGYLLPSFAAVGALFAAFVAALLHPLSRSGARAKLRLDEEKTPLDLMLDLVREPAARRSLVAAAAVAAMAALGLAQIYHGARHSSLADFHATDDFDDLGRRPLPPRSVLLAHAPATIFNFWGGQSEDALRPDVMLVPIRFLSYPGLVDTLIKRESELKDLLRGYLLYAELRPEALQSLAARRPLLVEMDLRIPPAHYASLAPAGLFYAVFAGGATAVDERLRARAQRSVYRQLYRRLYRWPGCDRLRPATRKRLIWHHFTDALYYMVYGDLESARAAVRMARKIEPRDRVLVAMQKALADETRQGPIDVTPFIKAIRQ